MKSRDFEKGSAAHIVIIVILVIALLGLLGYIFWQNFMNKNAPSNTTGTSQAVSVKTTDYEIYNNSEYGVSFEYPKGWTLNETLNSDEGIAFNVKNDLSEQVARFSIYRDAGGVGGACDPESLITVKTLDAEPFTGGAFDDDEVAFSASEFMNPGENVYRLMYGLSAYYTAKGEQETCPNTVYYIFSPKSAKFTSLNFGSGISAGQATRDFESLAELNAYVQGDEYKAIKKMILSLKY